MTNIFSNIVWNEDNVDTSFADTNIEGFQYGKMIFVRGVLKLKTTSTWKDIALVSGGMPPCAIMNQDFYTLSTSIDFNGYIPRITVSTDGSLRTYIRGNSLNGLVLQFSGFYMVE